MRYHISPPRLSKQAFGEIYICNHPAYNRCTLYKYGERGIAVIQQRYVKSTKHTYWTEIDDWIANALWLYPKFHTYLRKHAKEPVDGLYPTSTVRQVMWACRMKPMVREAWETVFDKKDF